MLSCICRRRYEYVAAYSRLIAQRGGERHVSNSWFPPLSNYSWLAVCELQHGWTPPRPRAQRASYLHSVRRTSRVRQFEYEYVKCCNHYLVLNSHLDSLLLRPPFWIFNPKPQPWASQRHAHARMYIHAHAHTLVHGKTPTHLCFW